MDVKHLTLLATEWFVLPAEERQKFRNAAEQEWQEWAGENEMTQKIYDSATAFLRSRNLL